MKNSQENIHNQFPWSQIILKNNLALTFRMAWNMNDESLNYRLNKIDVDNFDLAINMLLKEEIISELIIVDSVTKACNEVKLGHIVLAISGNKIINMAKSFRGSNILVNDRISSIIQFKRETKDIKEFYILKR